MLKSSQQFSGANLAMVLAAGTGIMAISKAADALIDWFKKNRIKSQSKEYYEKMLETHPELLKVDPNVLGTYWASLYHFSPFIAQDPLAAGAFVRQQLARGLEGGPSLDHYNMLAETQKHMKDSRKTDSDNMLSGMYKNILDQTSTVYPTFYAEGNNTRSR